MEKFSEWRDKGTGISPFMPLVSARGSRFLRLVADPVVASLKWALFVVFYLLAAVAPRPAVGVLLRLLGVSLDLAVEGVRRTNAAEIESHKPRPNEVVVANWLSPLDIFVLFANSDAKLHQLVVLVPKDGQVLQLTPWQFVHYTFGARIGTVVNEFAFEDKLVVLFPEGTPSNNAALLPFESVPSKLWNLKVPYKTVLLTWHPKRACLPIPYVSRSQYLFMLLAGESSRVKVKIVPGFRQYTVAGARQIFQDNGFPSVRLGVKEKAKFLEHYKAYRRH